MMRNLLEWLERTGKAFGWIGTIVSGVTAFAALFVALNNRDIARDNLRYQRINASLQFGTNLFRSLDDASERYGAECLAWLTDLDGEAVRRWISSGSLEGADVGTPRAMRCFAGLDHSASLAEREQFLSRQVYNRLNSYFLPLQALTSGAFDRQIICEDVKGIVDTPETQAFFTRAAPGTQLESVYALLASFYRNKPCG